MGHELKDAAHKDVYILMIYLHDSVQLFVLPLVLT